MSRDNQDENADGADRREGVSPTVGPSRRRRAFQSLLAVGSDRRKLLIRLDTGGIDGLPGIHITDHQMRLYMDY